MTKTELKAHAFDLVREIEKRQRHIQHLNAECHAINEEIKAIEAEIDKEDVDDTTTEQ